MNKFFILMFKNVFGATLLLSILIGISNISLAAPANNWDFNFVSRDGITLSYQGVTLISRSNLSVVTPGWTKFYYNQSSQKQNIVKKTDASWHITGKNEYFSAQYDLRPLDNQTFEIHFRGELLKDIKAITEFNTGFFNTDLFANRPFSAKIRETEKAPTHTVTGIVPAYSKTDQILQEDLAPNFQSLELDSRIGKMTLDVDATSPLLFADGRRWPLFVKKKYLPSFWCGWWAERQPLKVGEPIEMTLKIHIEPNAPQAPQQVTIRPEMKSVLDAFVPHDGALPIIPKPQKVLLDESRYFTIDKSTQWGIIAPSGETRLTPAVIRLMRDEWDTELPTPSPKQYTENGWSGIWIGKTMSESIFSKFQNEEWVKNTDAYHLIVNMDGIQIVSPTARGAFYGLQTLAQLLEVANRKTVAPYGEVTDWAVLEFRSALLWPTKQDVELDKKLIRLLARSKYNHIIIGSTQVQWGSHPETIWRSGQGAVSKDDLRELVNLSRENFLEPIPIVNGPGHAGFMMSYNTNSDLREDPGTNYAYSVKNPRSLKVLHDMMSELIDIFHPKYFHIGSDEVYQGRYPNPDNPYNDGTETTHSLILLNARLQQRWLAERGIKTIMWGDMFLNKQENKEEGIENANAPSAEIAQQERTKIPKNIIIADWQYSEYSNHEIYPSIDLFQKEGLTVFATPWYLPQNVRNFTLAAIRDKAKGIIQSTWVGADWGLSALTQRPEDFSALVLGADYSWSGRSEMPADLPYSPSTVLAHWLTPQFHSSQNGKLIDLSQVARVSAKDWLGLGNGQNLDDFFNEQKNAVTRRFDGIDFHIPDHKFVVLAPKPGVMAPEGALQELTLDVNEKTKEIAFLHSTLWDIPNANVHNWNKSDQSIVAQFIAEYTDGSTYEEYFLPGLNITSWRGNSIVGLAPQVWQGATSSGGATQLHLYRWVNPHPDKTIKNVQLKPGSVKAGYALAGITLLQ